jgi:parallel beta-helix repeat protein
MKPRLTRSIFCVSSLALVLAGFVAVPRATASAGFLVVTSDTTLTEDHDGSIYIAADNVTLDCAGHRVTGDGSGFGISVGANGVTVTNCKVQRFSTGIYTAAQGTRILGNVLVENGEGLRLSGATGATVSDNTARESDLWGIIACCHASENTISDNTTRKNRLLGIGLNNASSNRVTGNVSRQNGNGFDISFSSEFNTILNNVAANNAGTGFGFTAGNNNLIEGNVSMNNGEGPAGGGFVFNNSSGNTVTNNIAKRNGSTGFNVFFGSELNLFSGNHACKNFFGDAFDSSIGLGNTWIDNDFCNSAL